MKTIHLIRSDSVSIRMPATARMIGVATGRSNEEIARELVVSPATVRTHVSRAMVKLGARTRAQLVVAAMRAGMTIDAYQESPRSDI